MSDVVIELPEGLEKEARAAGILDPDYLASMLRREMRRRRVNRLFSAADRLAESGVEISEAEVAAEIEAVRKERRA